MDQGGGRFETGWESLERVEGVPNTLAESLTKFGSQETVFMSFYRKSAGVLQDVLEFLQDVCNFSTGCLEMGFWRMDG